MDDACSLLPGDGDCGIGRFGRETGELAGLETRVESSVAILENNDKIG